MYACTFCSSFGKAVLLIDQGARQTHVAEIDELKVLLCILCTLEKVGAEHGCL